MIYGLSLNAHNDHELNINPNDIKGNTTFGAMFQTQSVYMTVGSSIEAHKVMSCMTFDPPMPVESGIEDQVHKDKQTNSLFIQHTFFCFKIQILINATDAMMIGVSIHNKNMVRRPHVSRTN